MVFQTKKCSNITHIWEVTIYYPLEISKSQIIYEPKFGIYGSHVLYCNVGQKFSYVAKNWVEGIIPKIQVPAENRFSK